MIQPIISGTSRWYWALAVGFLCSLSAPVRAEVYKIEKKKSVIKVYDVTSKNNLLIDNQFGQVKVNLWDKNEIRVDIRITANSDTDDRAQHYLNGVDIEDKQEGGQISIRTIINKDERMNRNAGNSKERNFVHIDYAVFMPKNTPLNVKNRFGVITIPVFKAPLMVESEHGSFIATDLSGSKNDIDVAFGKADIQQLLNGNVAIAYSGGRIGTLKGSSKIKLSFSGGFRFEQLKELAEDVAIEAVHSAVVIPTENNDCHFDVTVVYAGFKYPNDRNVTFTQNDDNRPEAAQRYISRTAKQYIGKFGKGNGTKVKIVSKYGEVTLR
ncbi:MAG: hypothetical protein U0X91_25455 [Spirosomataceae bacterium]